MLKAKSIINIKVNNKEYEFFCDPDSPLNDALDANMQINAFLIGRIEQAKIVQKPVENIPVPPIDLPTQEKV
jgi:hypothetical protein